MVCSLPPGDYNLTRGCHGEGGIKPASFSHPVCSHTEETSKNAETGSMRRSPNCYNRKQWVEKDKISIYLVQVNFSKIVAFKVPVL
jgi:hypothetical protein